MTGSYLSYENLDEYFDALEEHQTYLKARQLMIRETVAGEEIQKNPKNTESILSQLRNGNLQPIVRKKRCSSSEQTAQA